MGWLGGEATKKIECQVSCVCKESYNNYKRHVDISLGRVYRQLMSRMDGNMKTA